MNMVELSFFLYFYHLYSNQTCAVFLLPYINYYLSEVQCDLINTMFLLVISGLCDGRSTDERHFYGTCKAKKVFFCTQRMILESANTDNPLQNLAETARHLDIRTMAINNFLRFFVIAFLHHTHTIYAALLGLNHTALILVHLQCRTPDSVMAVVITK